MIFQLAEEITRNSQATAASGEIQIVCCPNDLEFKDNVNSFHSILTLVLPNTGSISKS